MTEVQVSRRKTWAIVLIGIGLVVIPLLKYYLRHYTFDTLENKYQYITWLLIISSFFTLLTLASGWLTINKFLDKRKTDFIKHWIIAIVCMNVLPYFPYGSFVVQVTMRSLITVIMSAYMIGAIDSARKNSEDPEIWTAVRIIQNILATKILFYASQLVLAILYYLMRGQLTPMGDYFIQWLPYVLSIILFLGERKLIRSSLFVSTYSQVEEYAQRMKSRTSFLNAAVCGAIAGAILCAGLTFVAIRYWNDIYYNFV